MQSTVLLHREKKKVYRNSHFLSFAQKNPQKGNGTSCPWERSLLFFFLPILSSDPCVGFFNNIFVPKMPESSMKNHHRVIHTRSSLPTHCVSCGSGSYCPGRKSFSRTRSVGSRALCWPCLCGPWSPPSSCAPWWCRSCAGGLYTVHCSTAAVPSRHCRTPDPVHWLLVPVPWQSRVSASALF